MKPYYNSRKKNNFCNLLRIAKKPQLEGVADSNALDKDSFREIFEQSYLSTTPSCISIMPPIYHNIKRYGVEDLIEEERHLNIKNKVLGLITFEVIKEQQLKKIIKLLTAANIPLLLLKSSAFNNSLYDKSYPRVGMDIDFLVKIKHFESVCHILMGTMKALVPPSNRVATFNTLFERVFLPSDRREAIIEVHQGLTNPFIFNIKEESIWEKSRTHPAYNSEFVRMLSPAHSLLHLAVHAFRDLDFCSHNLLDTHEIWCQWQPDEKSLLEAAEEWRAQKVLFYLLSNCKTIMNTPIPDTLLCALKPNKINNKLNSSLLKVEHPSPLILSRLSYRLCQLLSQLTFPDFIINGVKFQLFYLWIRLLDLITPLNARKQKSCSCDNEERNSR